MDNDSSDADLFLVSWYCELDSFLYITCMVRNFPMKTNIEPYVTLFVCGGLLAYVYGLLYTYLFIVGGCAFIIGLLLIGMWATGDYEDYV